MPESFDPYLQWLGIRDAKRPPNHYRLLGVELFESDQDVIANAADRQMTHVHTFQTGKRSAVSQKLLNELSQAKLCLLNASKKAAYDATLRAELKPTQSEMRVTSPPPLGPPTQPPPLPAQATPRQPPEPLFSGNGLPAGGLPPLHSELSPDPLASLGLFADSGRPSPAGAAIPIPLPTPKPVQSPTADFLGSLSAADRPRESDARARLTPPDRSWLGYVMALAVLIAVVAVAVLAYHGRLGPEAQGWMASLVNRGSGETTKAPGEKPTDGNEPDGDAPPPTPVKPPEPPKPVVESPVKPITPAKPVIKLPDEAIEPEPKVEAKPAPRKQPPTGEDLNAAVRRVRDLYRDKYATAKDPLTRQALAQLLSKKAMDTPNDLVTRYALLAQARDLALEAEDRQLLEEIAGNLTAEYEVDRLILMSEAVQRAANKPRPTLGQVRIAIDLAQEARGQQRPDVAKSMAAKAREMATTAKEYAAAREAAALLRELEGRPSARPAKTPASGKMP